MDYSNVVTIVEILGSSDVTTLYLTNDAYHVIDFLDTLDQVYERHVITGSLYGHRTLIKIQLQLYVSVHQMANLIARGLQSNDRQRQNQATTHQIADTRRVVSQEPQDLYEDINADLDRIITDRLREFRQSTSQRDTQCTGGAIPDSPESPTSDNQ